jgi:glutamine synthetase
MKKLPKFRFFIHPVNIQIFLDYPVWNFDGSSTGQSTGSVSDVHLQPVADFPDPFLGGNNRLVMCETYDHFNRPTPTNFRNKCNEIMKRVAHEEPWFGMEQEYLVLF